MWPGGEISSNYTFISYVVVFFFLTHRSCSLTSELNTQACCPCLGFWPCKEKARTADARFLVGKTCGKQTWQDLPKARAAVG